jgi:hypothetical protein
MVPGIVLGVGIFFLPFSPRWLSSQGRDAEALAVLAQLRRLPASDARLFQEWCEIRAEVAAAGAHAVQQVEAGAHVVGGLL